MPSQQPHRNQPPGTRHLPLPLYRFTSTCRSRLLPDPLLPASAGRRASRLRAAPMHPGPTPYLDRRLDAGPVVPPGWSDPWSAGSAVSGCWPLFDSSWSMRSKRMDCWSFTAFSSASRSAIFCLSASRSLSGALSRSLSGGSASPVVGCGDPGLISLAGLLIGRSRICPGLVRLVVGGSCGVSVLSARAGG